MASIKRPYEFKDKITVDFLQSSYMDHQQTAEELALSEIHSLELAMPKFNTIATLNKFEFNKLMLNIKRKFKDTQAFTVMVAAISDTFTCMIQNNKFYDNFAGDNKSGLELMMGLLHTINLLLVTYHRGIETKQLETLIEILERSAERIQTETEHYKIMQQIISSLRTRTQDKENKIQARNRNTQTDSQGENKTTLKILHKDTINTNDKLPLDSLNNKKMCVKSDIDCEINLVTVLDNKSLAKSVQQAHVVPLKPQVHDKKPTNAFELMMMSSKRMKLKKKGSI